jgi:hypothetical protein
MAFDRSKYPLVLLKGIESVLDSFSDIEEQNGELITEASPSNSPDTQMLRLSFVPYHISYIPRDEAFDFYFELRGIRYNNSIIEYWVRFKPSSPSSIEEAEAQGKLEATESRLKNWISLLKQYNTVRLSKKERFTAESAEQFYADFELVDEDANTAPFDNDKQVLVYKLLEFVKETVEHVEDGDQEESKLIVQQIESLQQIIPTITKAAVLKELSKVYAKVKAYSMKAFVAVYDVAKKELIKHYLYKSMDGVNNFIETLHLPHH